MHPSPLPTTSFTDVRKVEASANISLLKNLPKLSERQFGKKSSKVFSFSFCSIMQLQVARPCFVSEVRPERPERGGLC
jgi:hypothetical protein